MDVMELGAIGELVGGVAVLVTLVYLAIQVRQSNALARVQVRQEASRMATDIGFYVANPEVIEFATRARSYEALSDDERRRAAALFTAILNVYETLFYSRSQGLVEDDLWESRKARLEFLLGAFGSDLWDACRSRFGRKFQTFVDGDILPAARSLNS